jgi:hypothetical protein
MKRSLLTFLLVLYALSPAVSRAAPVEINNAPALQTVVDSDVDVSLRLIGGRGAVLMPGRDINLTFQTNADAYVIIYNIDTEGYVHLLYPADGRPEMVRGKKVHFLPEQGAGTTWEVGGKTGMEYIHAIAVADPSRIDRDELYYLAQNSVMPEERRLRIDMDPFLAFNMIDEELIGEAERMAPSTDYTYFYINRQVEYPGYLCYKCHSPSKLPDPYAMECPEVDIEMIAVNEDAGYPYPQLFAVLQAGDAAPEDDYESYTYYADNLGLDDDYDYDEQNVYLSVYYTNSYPYCGYWPGYWSWYNTCYPSSWYWGYSWGIGWGWGGSYYCHHYHGWYHGGYHAYWHGYNHGYWNGYWAGGGGSGYYAPVNKRSLYAGRSFTKRGSLDYGSTRVKKPVGSSGSRDLTRRGSLEYTSTRVKKSRETTLASSRLVKDRTRAATARSYRNSRLARQVTRERASTGFRSFNTSRFDRGGSSPSGGRVYGNYGTTRSARSSNQPSTRSTTRTRNRNTGSRGDLKVDKGDRRYERSTTGTSRSRGGTRRENTGSQLERRVRQRRDSRDNKKTEVPRSTNRRSSTRRKNSTSKGSSARSKRDSDSVNSGSSTKSSPRKSSSRDSGARKSSKRSSSQPSRNTNRSSGSRSSGKRSSGSRSSGSRSGGRSSGKSSGRRR